MLGAAASSCDDSRRLTDMLLVPPPLDRAPLLCLGAGKTRRDRQMRATTSAFRMPIRQREVHWHQNKNTTGSACCKCASASVCMRGEGVRALKGFLRWGTTLAQRRENSWLVSVWEHTVL